MIVCRKFYWTVLENLDQGWTQLHPLAAVFQLCDLDAKSPYISTSPHPPYLTLFDPWQLSVLVVGAHAFKLT